MFSSELLYYIDTKVFLIVQLIFYMVVVDKEQSIEEILKTIDKIACNPDELAHWTTAVEATAKQMCEDKGSKIEFVYCPEEKSMRFFVKDNESRDCLVDSIEIHLPLMPTLLQGFFSVFKYNLKKVNFDVIRN